MLMTKASKRLYCHCVQASTLRVTIPDKIGKNSPEEDSDDFVFNRVDVETEDAVPSTGKEAHIVVKRVIQDNSHSTVYLGLMRDTYVILKCCYNTDFYKDFRREAWVYKKRLEELQGTVVPVCFGYYLALDDLYGPYSLLLLEYCGESLSMLSMFFEDLEVEQRVKILTLLGMCHSKARIHPNDFAERNVVVRNGRYRLIDFHDIEGHECDYYEGFDWQPGEFFLEAQSDFPCDTLAELGEEMGIWSTNDIPIVTIHGRVFPDDGFPPQDIIDKLIPYNFVGAPENWEWATFYLKQVRQEMDKDPDNSNLNALLARRPRPPLDPDAPPRLSSRSKKQSC